MKSFLIQLLLGILTNLLVGFLLVLALSTAIGFRQAFEFWVFLSVAYAYFTSERVRLGY